MSFQKYISGKPVVQVYLLDNSFRQLLIEPSSTVHDVCLMMARKLGTADPEDDCLLLSLNEARDGVAIGRALKRETLVMDILREWETNDATEAKLVCQIHLFTEGLMDSKDERIREMLYMQTVYNVISGMYPTDKEDALKLASLQFVHKFGELKPETHKPGFLGSKLREFIPIAHINGGTITLTEWEASLYASVARVDTATPMKDYIEHLRYRDYFGSVVYAVKQKFEKDPEVLPKRVFMGISRQGILLLRIPENYTSRSMTTFRRFPLGDIFRWAFKPDEHFYFEVKAEDGGEKPDEFKFKTTEGEDMSDLLTDYAMALLREMGLNPDGTKRERVAPGAADGSAAAAASGPAQSSMPTSLAIGEAAFAGIAGDVGALASAATRSGVAEEEEEEDDEDEELEEEAAEADAGADEDGEALPPGWTKQYDEDSQRHYYFNVDTEESSWDVPTERFEGA